MQNSLEKQLSIPFGSSLRQTVYNDISAWEGWSAKLEPRNPKWLERLVAPGGARATDIMTDLPISLYAGLQSESWGSFTVREDLLFKPDLGLIWTKGMPFRRVSCTIPAVKLPYLDASVGPTTASTEFGKINLHFEVTPQHSISINLNKGHNHGLFESRENCEACRINELSLDYVRVKYQHRGKGTTEVEYTYPLKDKRPQKHTLKVEHTRKIFNNVTGTVKVKRESEVSGSSKPETKWSVLAVIQHMIS